MPAFLSMLVLTCFSLARFSFVAAVVQGETESRSNTHRAIRESFQYNPAVREKSQEKHEPSRIPKDDPTPQTESDSDVIILPKFEIKSPPLLKGLVEAVASSRSMEPQNQSKLGTGIHEKDFGKVRAYAMTVFYVPIMVGLRW